MNKKTENYFEMKIKAVPENVKFVRSAIATFSLPLEPTYDEVQDLQTAVSEAFTNAVVHAYPEKRGECEVDVSVSLDKEEHKISITIGDHGVGIKNFEKAREPFFSTAENVEEHCGMGFTIMETFMDNLSLQNNEGRGVKLIMAKTLGRSKDSAQAECSC